MKICTNCNTPKALDEFALNKKSKDGRNWKCKRCHGIYKKKLYYGLSEEQYLMLLEVQNYKCAICSEPISESTAHVDHSHLTNKTRALLCFNCNTALGKFKDEPVILRKAADYIERHKK